MAQSPGINASSARNGVDAATGQLLTGWAHCQQSLAKIFTTAFNERVMRLTFGSKVPAMVDRPGNAAQIGQFYSSVTSAILAWEPGYRIQTMQLSAAGPDGHYTFDYTGTFYPRGHLGDYSVSESRAGTLSLTK